MRRLQYTILILCFLCPQLLWAQRRFMTAERWEYRLEQVSGFSTKDVENKVDIFWGLHKSQYAGTHHLFGFSMEGSYTSFVNNMPNAAFLPAEVQQASISCMNTSTAVYCCNSVWAPLSNRYRPM